MLFSMRNDVKHLTAKRTISGCLIIALGIVVEKMSLKLNPFQSSVFCYKLAQKMHVINLFNCSFLATLIISAIFRCKRERFKQFNLRFS